MEAEGHIWVLLVTEFIAGVPTRRRPPDLWALGVAAGRLHALPTGSRTPAPGSAALSSRPAGMLPANELAYALSCLAAIQSRITPELRHPYEVLLAAVQDAGASGELPRTLIHNDCHPGNSIYTPDGTATLVGWEGAGLGPAVIDLGFLLASCEIPASCRNRLVPNQALLEHVMDGYLHHRRLTGPEIDALAGAVRFRSLVAAAVGFAASVARNGRGVIPLGRGIAAWRPRKSRTVPAGGVTQWAAD